MTSISALSGTSTSALRPQRKDPMQAVTDLLGGDKKAIMDALKSGQSLDDIAKSKGVSHDDLVAAIEKGLPADASGSSDPAATAEQIATTKGLPQGPQGARGAHGGHHHRPDGDGDGGAAATGAVGSTGAAQDRLDALSTLLGTDSTTLVQDLLNGSTLTGLASAKGVSTAQVSAALEQGDLHDSYL